MYDTNATPKGITVDDILNGCQCTVVYLAGEASYLRCVTCPIHGDIEFRQGGEG